MNENPLANKPSDTNQLPAAIGEPTSRKLSLDVGEGLAALAIAAVSLYLLQGGTLEGWNFFAACFMLLAAAAGVFRFIGQILARCCRS